MKGTEVYDVEIQLAGDHVHEWLCGCPYDGVVCKHVVATLLLIRKRGTKTINPTPSGKHAEKPRKATKREQVDELLSKFKREDLEQYERLIKNIAHSEVNATAKLEGRNIIKMQSMI